MSTYELSCDCGGSITVRSADAGSEKLCECGQSIRVPSLSGLRQLAGRNPYEAGVLETIVRELGECNDNVGDVCLISGRPTSDRLWFELVCEQSSIKRGSKSADVSLLSGVIGGLASGFGIPFGNTLSHMFFKDEMTEEPNRQVGHDRCVRLVIPISMEHQATISKSKIKSCAKQVPIYAKVFEAYPRAKVRRLKS